MDGVIDSKENETRFAPTKEQGSSWVRYQD
jgi:hypothetical protein